MTPQQYDQLQNSVQELNTLRRQLDTVILTITTILYLDIQHEDPTEEK